MAARHVVFTPSSPAMSSTNPYIVPMPEATIPGRGSKRLQYQVDKDAGASVSTWRIMARLDATQPWVQLAASSTTPAIGEIAPYREIGFVVDGVVGGNWRMTLNDPD